MTGQLALAFPDPIPVVEAHHREITVRRVEAPAPRRMYLWWRGRRQLVRNIDIVLPGVL